MARNPPPPAQGAKYDRAGRASGDGLVLAGDRSRHFSRAKVHSVFVRTLRVGFPLATIILIGTYVGSMLRTSGWSPTPVAPPVQPTIAKEITMDKPRYEGFTKDGGNFVVNAATAIPDLSNPSIVKLNAITGEMFDARKSRTDLAATRGIFDNKTNKLDLFEGITVVTQTGMTAQLTTATLMTKEGTMLSKDPVKVTMPTGTITSNQMSLNQKTRDVTFEVNVVAHLTPPPKPEQAVAAPAKAASKATNPFGNSTAPIDVTSNRLDVHDGKKTAIFTGHVIANQGPARIETETLEIAYVGNAAAVGQPAAPATVTPAAGPDGVAPAASPAAKVQRIIAPGPVVLTQATGDRVTGNAADFDAVGESAVITGSVVMTSGIDRRAASDRAEFQQKADTITLTGGVVVNQGRNELRGRLLVVDRKAGRTVLTSPAEGTIPKSRIFAKLYQGDPAQAGKPSASSKAVATPAADSGPASALGMTTFKTDPNAPVDIEADRLVVEDSKKEAIFYGDVKAVQGDFIIRTSELKAAYSGEAGISATGFGQTTTPSPAKAPSQLTRIDAKGKVVVTSKVGQQVTGDWAIFDTKANTVTVGGTEVILTQDKNMVQGNKLVIDMPTGESKMVREAGPVAEGSAPVKSGRSSLVFYPEDRQKGTIKQVKPAAPAKPAASSWEATSSPAPSPNN
jgi:LPS export ABC transporter protein LptC